MELEWLKEFEVLAKTGKYSSAAAMLNLSASALTRHMQNLERELGCRLFERTTRSVALTEQGRIVLEHASIMNEQADEMKRKLKRTELSSQNQVHIGVIQNPDLYQAMDMILNFQLLNPDDEIHIEEGNLEWLHDQLEAGTLHLITDACPSDKSMPEHFIQVGSSQLMAAVLPDHPLAGRNEVSLEELCGWKLIAPEKNSMVWHLFEQHLKDKNLKADIVYQGTLSGAMRMLKGSRFVLLQDEAKLKQEKNSGLVLMKLQEPIQYAYGLSWKGKTARAEEDFIRYIKENCKNSEND